MKKFIRHFVIIASIGILPLIVVDTIGLCSDKKYDQSFYGGLAIKEERLTSIKDKNKIVFVGGSSLSFGLRSEMMSEALGYEIVDYGLYAPMGTKMMSELVYKSIKKGDIVVFAPEISSETYSTKMNFNMFYKCAEKNPHLLDKLSLDNRMQALASYPYFVSEKVVTSVEASAPYDRDSFNAYGDIESPIVAKNVLKDFYDSSQMISPSSYLLDKDFISYVNSYAKKINRKGGKTYFTFSPSNTLSLIDEHLEEFENGLNEKLNIKVLGDVKTFTYHQNYFYDTNYHLNYAGTIIHSQKMVEVIAKELDINVTYQFPEVEMPKAKYEDEESPITEDMFTISKSGEDYFLNSVDGALKEKEIIRVPDTIGNNTITGINKDAFKDFNKLKYVILPNKVSNLSNGIFDGCSSLERIYLTNLEAPEIVGKGFLDGCNPNVKIYILRSARKTYSTGYTWADYKSRFVLYNIEDIENY